MAVNYLEEGARAVPAPINAFHKSPNSVIGDGESMVLPDVPATVYEGETELGVVFGKRATGVAAADAMNYVFGYLNFIDGSARGLPPKGNTSYQMKSRDTFAPMGPFLVTADEVPDPHALQVRLWVNGVLKQNYNTATMAYNIPRSISWVTSMHTFEPGDLLAMGTDHRGLGAIQDGDLIEMETEGLGRLSVHVQVLAVPDAADRAAAAVFAQTTTLGVRWHVVERRILAREQVQVELGEHILRVKLAIRGDMRTAKVESDDLRAVAGDRTERERVRRVAEDGEAKNG